MTRLMIRSPLALLACAGLALPALAQAQTEARPAQVRYADLDLSTSAGRATLDKRIATAARTVCAEPAETGSLARNTRAERVCRADVRAQAEARLAERLS